MLSSVFFLSVYRPDGWRYITSLLHVTVSQVGTGGQTLATDNADKFVLVAFLSLTDCTFLEDICEGC